MNIWTGLLFMEGALADADLAQDLAEGTEQIETSPLEVLTDTPEREAQTAREALGLSRAYTIAAFR